MKAAELGVEVRDVLQNVLGLDGEVRNKEYYVHCPHPRHQDSSPSCSVNLKTGLWHCFSCGAGGDIVSLTSLVLVKSRKQAIGSLTEGDPTGPFIRQIGEKLRKEFDKRVSESIEPMALPDRYMPRPLDYMLDRGFTRETLRRWGVQFCPNETFEGRKGPYTIQNYIAIPVKNERGTLLFWVYRKTSNKEDWQPRYLNTPQAPIANTWFGVEHHSKAESVVVVEGLIDAMWLDQQGIPALGLMGSSSISMKKLRYLRRYRQVTIMMDRDNAGYMAMQKIADVLGTSMPVAIARYPKFSPATDPQGCTSAELHRMVERALPYVNFRLKNGQG